LKGEKQMIQITGYPALGQGLQFLKNYVRQREEKGERTIVFSEDRLTLLAEQAICEELGGTFLTNVSTFARFLRRSGKTLSKQGSVMVIGKLLSDNAKELRCFSSRASARNGAQAVYEMISQLSASKVTPAMLEECEVEEGLLKDKLHDLALIYGKYLDFLRTNDYLDENSYLSLLPSAIYEDEKTIGASIVFLGFTSFTAQALDGVRAACERAKDVLGLLPAGKGGLYSNQAATAF
jgi:ATP-dependent helicase/DNAse subunit B